MSETQDHIAAPQDDPKENLGNIRMPQVRISSPSFAYDWATILGLVLSLAMIGAAIFLGDTKGQFFNLRAVFIVIFGTIAVTCISYTGRELKQAGHVLMTCLFITRRDPKKMVHQLLDIAVIAKLRGPLALTNIRRELKNDPYLGQAVEMVIDDLPAAEINTVLTQDRDAQLARQHHGAGILRRAAEIAPAMGLIGTLLGLVQMLAQLDDPTSIGPAMATALLTTFYGAIMGSVILTPLAAKLERNAQEEAYVKQLVITAMGSVSRTENPRHLEVKLNSELSPENRIKYFK